MSEEIVAAYQAWLDGTAYLDNAGNFRIREPGSRTRRGAHIGIAPWNKAVKRLYGPGSSRFHEDALAWFKRGGE